MPERVSDDMRQYRVDELDATRTALRDAHHTLAAILWQQPNHTFTITARTLRTLAEMPNDGEMLLHHMEGPRTGVGGQVWWLEAKGAKANT